MDDQAQDHRSERDAQTDERYGLFEESRWMNRIPVGQASRLSIDA